MGKQLWANNAKSVLASGITDSALSLTVDTGDGALFPAITGSDFFKATLYKITGGQETDHEIVLVTARSSDTFTIVRGQEGTTPIAFSSGDFVELRLTAAFLTETVDRSVKTGFIEDYAGGSVLDGYYLCDGSNQNRTTDAALFAAIGTTYGVGDGSTTFRLPDFRRRVAVGSGGTGTGTLGNTVGNFGGAETHTLSSAEMPSHTHTQNAHSHLAGETASVGSGLSGSYRTTATTGNATSSTTATNQNTGGGGGHNNMQPSLVVTKMIKR